RPGSATPMHWPCKSLCTYLSERYPPASRMSTENPKFSSATPSVNPTGPDPTIKTFDFESSVRSIEDESTNSSKPSEEIVRSSLTGHVALKHEFFETATSGLDR